MTGQKAPAKGPLIEKAAERVAWAGRPRGRCINPLGAASGEPAAEMGTGIFYVGLGVGRNANF